MRQSVVLLFVLVGCGSVSRVDGGTGGGSSGTGGGSSSTGGGTGTTGLSVTQFCTDFADAWCAQDERCGWLQSAQRMECRTRVAADCEIPLADVEWSFAPSGGPGGQHANKAHTRAVARLDLTTCAALTEAQRERSTTYLQDERKRVKDRMWKLKCEEMERRR